MGPVFKQMMVVIHAVAMKDGLEITVKFQKPILVIQILAIKVHVCQQTVVTPAIVMKAGGVTIVMKKYHQQIHARTNLVLMAEPVRQPV